MGGAGRTAKITETDWFPTAIYLCAFPKNLQTQRSGLTAGHIMVVAGVEKSKLSTPSEVRIACEGFSSGNLATDALLAGLFVVP